MKKKKITVPESALVVEGFTEYHPGFESKEAMVAYYMQMNEFVNFGLQAPLAQELPYMVGLLRKLKLFLLLLQRLDEHKWGKGITNLQTACTAYVIKEDVGINDRTEVSRNLSELIEFLISVAEDKSTIRQLHGILAAHYKNVMNIIEERIAANAAEEMQKKQAEEQTEI